MLDIIVATAFLVGGSIVLTFAERLSAFEKRLLDAHPWTKVTGWAGTRKGVLAWRCVGGMLLVVGAAWLLDALFSSLIRSDA